MTDFKKSGWDKYRAIRKAFWISVLWFFVCCLGSQILPPIIPCTIGKYLPSWLGACVLFLPAFVFSTLLQHYKCPRCGKSFFYDGVWLAWTKNCLHCHLPKWEEAGYVNPDSEKDYIRTLSIAEMATDATISAMKRNSRFLILILRDDPGAIHLSLDSDGWADVNNLLTRANRYGFKLTREDLADVLSLSGNPGFEWDQPGSRIRFVRN